jgi:hypothetical protein
MGGGGSSNSKSQNQDCGCDRGYPGAVWFVCAKMTESFLKLVQEHGGGDVAKVGQALIRQGGHWGLVQDLLVVLGWSLGISAVREPRSKGTEGWISSGLMAPVSGSLLGTAGFCKDGRSF